MVGRQPLPSHQLAYILACMCLLAFSGCSLFPDVRHKPQYSNPFPQLTRIAILPFYNQSDEPTLSGRLVSTAYYNEMQSIPGFEVLPLGVVENALEAFGREPQMGSDFQEFARFLGVDAVLVGSITDYSAYYPPRLTLRTNWYAANPSFHPIPVGYGLPWGTSKEKNIPSWIKLEAERELAKKQLETQTPLESQIDSQESQDAQESKEQLAAEFKLVEEALEANQGNPNDVPMIETVPEPPSGYESIDALPENRMPSSDHGPAEMDDLPTQWPDPRGFIPAAPSSRRPMGIPQSEPIITHMRAYNGNDEDITKRLEEYYYFRDEIRNTGWQAYLKRSEDFIRFCCHLHVTETLASRGGELESRVIFRWPIGRYQR